MWQKAFRGSVSKGKSESEREKKRKRKKVVKGLQAV